MGETEYKIFLQIYQQKTFDLLNQVIALEVRNNIYSQNIDSLNSKIKELSTIIERKEIEESLKAKQKRKSSEKLDKNIIENDASDETIDEIKKEVWDSENPGE
jgi:hypothetical protein